MSTVAAPTIGRELHRYVHPDGRIEYTLIGAGQRQAVTFEPVEFEGLAADQVKRNFIEKLCESFGLAPAELTPLARNLV